MVHFGPFRGRRIMAYLEGEMSAAERASFEAHMKVCEWCRREVESRRPVLELLARNTFEVAVPTEVAARIRERVREEEIRKSGRLQNAPQFALAAAAICFLVVGISIGYIAAHPMAGRGVKYKMAANLPKVDEVALYDKLMRAKRQLMEAGRDREASELDDVGHLIENLAVAKGNDVAPLLARRADSPILVSEPSRLPQSVSPENLEAAYKRIIEQKPSTAESAMARVKLAELYYNRGEWRKAQAAYVLYKSLCYDQYKNYARRNEVDHRLRLLAESQKNNFKTLDLYREAMARNDASAYEMYSDIIMRQAKGELARMAVMEMAKFGWDNGRFVRRSDSRFTKPEDKINALMSLARESADEDVRVLAQTSIGDIYRDELGDIDSATNAYHVAVDEYPQTIMANEVRGRLNKLARTSISFR